MNRVVIDTNTWIRYLIKPSQAIRRLVEDEWLRDRLQLISSPELLRELAAVLARPHIQALIQAAEAEVLLTAVRYKAELLPPLATIPAYSRDPKDDKFVACAVAGMADYLITLDDDLLILGQVAQVQILRPAEYLALLPGEINDA